MKTWWNNKLDKATFDFEGKTFQSSDCNLFSVRTGLLKIDGKILQFDVPEWDSKSIYLYQQCNDELLGLGLRAVPSTIAPLTINQPNQAPLTIDVLVRQNVEQYCENNSVLIYDENYPQQKFIGKQFNFTEIGFQFESPTFGRHMFKTLLADYILSIAYNLPGSNISNLKCCLELTEEVNTPPTARLIALQIPNWHYGAQFTAWPETSKIKSDLKRLINIITARFMEISPRNDLSWDDEYRLREEIERNLFVALNDEVFINSAYDMAALAAAKYKFDKLMNKFEQLRFSIETKASKNPEKYKELLRSANKLVYNLKAKAEECFRTLDAMKFNELTTFCESEIEAAKSVFNEHRGFGAFHPLLRALLGVIATITAIPAIIVSLNSSAGYYGTFFCESKTESAKQLQSLRDDIPILGA